MSPADAQLDRDGDGTSNLDECIFGRPASVPDHHGVVLCRTPGSGKVTVAFPSALGRRYRVWWSATLAADGWQSGSVEMEGTGGLLSWTDESAVTGRRFYRVEAVVMAW